MTGEMFFVRKDGTDSDGNKWELQAAIARQLHGELHPFDVYQGPYVTAIGRDIRAGSGPYAMPVRHLGIVRLWVVSWEDDTDFCQVYREDTDKLSEPFWPYTHKGMNTRAACKAARSLL